LRKSYACGSAQVKGPYMQDKILNVTQTARLLDTDNTYIYKLIRQEQLTTVQANPYRVSFAGVKSYLDSRLPESFACYATVPL
tara:strand:+ start:645 stop:893 length:249 start_codon:yes stop_codon:yes gene_type:complete